MKQAIFGILIILLGAGAWYFFSTNTTQFEAPPPAQPVVIERPEPVQKPKPRSEPELPGVVVEEPPTAEPEPVVEAEPLPPLGDSDALVLESLNDLLGEPAVMQFVLSEDVISRFVASVDALTSRQVPGQIMAVQNLGGEFEASADLQPDSLILNEEGDPIPQFDLDSRNFQRYSSQVELFEAVNTGELLALYQGLSPLFDQAWADLGYPKGSFDERLLVVIDSLLATPDAQAPIRLIKPEAFYLFADPELEALPAGQKVLLRMGSTNAGRVKAKLQEIRDLLVAAG